MSLSYYEGMKPVKLPDPRIDVRTQDKYLFKQPANVVTYKTFNNNSTSSSSTHFTATPPNPNIIISPLVYLNAPMRLTVTASSAPNGAPYDARATILGPNPTICPRQLPIASVIQTLSLKLNTDTTSVNLNEYIHALSRFYSDDAIRAYEMSSCPVQPDFFQKYNDWSNTGAGQATGLNLGTARSPFGKWGENTNEPTRSSYLPYRTTYFADADNGTASLDYDFDEPLFVSPLSSGEYTKMGLIQIQTFDLDITWDSSRLNRAFSCDGVGLNALTYDTGGHYNISTQILEPRLRFIYMTPHVNYPIPDTVIYEFADISRFPKNVGTLAGWDPTDPNTMYVNKGQQTTVRSDNIQLSNIPNKIYIYARRQNNDRTIYTTDSFARIEKIDIDFNGVSGIMASADEIDLWRMSVDNGARLSWADWRFYGGSVLCIDFGKNLGLSPQQGVGMLGTYNFSYGVTISNISTEDVYYTLYTIIESVGTLTIQNQQVIKQVGILTSKDAIDAPDASQAEARLVESMYGGSFMSGMKNLYANTKSFAKKHAPKVERGLEILGDIPAYLDANPKLKKGLSTGAKVAASVLPMLLGLGYTKKQIEDMAAAGYKKKDFENLIRTMQGAPVGRGGNMLLGGNPVGGKGIVGFPTGGAMMGKSKLMNRVKYEY